MTTCGVETQRLSQFVHGRRLRSLGVDEIRVVRGWRVVRCRRPGHRGRRRTAPAGGAEEGRSPNEIRCDRSVYEFRGMCRPVCRHPVRLGRAGGDGPGCAAQECSRPPAAGAMPGQGLRNGPRRRPTRASGTPNVADALPHQGLMRPAGSPRPPLPGCPRPSGATGGRRCGLHLSDLVGQLDLPHFPDGLQAAWWVCRQAAWGTDRPDTGGGSRSGARRATFVRSLWTANPNSPPPTTHASPRSGSCPGQRLPARPSGWPILV